MARNEVDICASRQRSGAGFLKQTIVITRILAMPIAGHNMLLKGYPRSTMLRTKRKLVRFGGRRVTQVFQAKEQY